MAVEVSRIPGLRDTRPLKSGLRFLVALWQEQPWATVALAGAVAVQGVLPAARLWVLGRLVHGLAAAVRGAGPAPVGALALLAATMAAAGVVGLAVAALEEDLRDRTTQSLQRRILEKAAAIELAFFEQEDAHNRLQRAVAATGMELATFYSTALQPLQAVVTAIALAATLATAAWWLGPLIVLAGLPVLWMRLVRTAHNFGWKLDQSPIERRRGYFQRLLFHRESAKEVRVFGLGGHLLDRWRQQQLALQDGAIGQAAAEARVSLAAETLLILALGGATLLLAFEVSGGSLGIGAYVMLAQAATELQGAVDQVLVGLRGAYLRALTADDVFTFLDRPLPPAPAGGHLPFPALREGITFDDVWFRYGEEGEWALQGVSFHVRAHETIALVGQNGAGKSTLIHLLLGLYRPQRGTIRFDGVPIEQIDEADLRRHCSAIFQDFARFQLTLRESIGVGNVARIDDAAGVRHAAGQAGADGIAADLTHGYETVLGPAFGGVDLSGGQWQKVALARSLMREADVLVLDEPTASLDPRAEMAVFEEFAGLARGRTTFLISHRIGTARLADRILVLRGGRLVEAGHHAELVRAGGEYAGLFAAQRQWYAAEAGANGHE